MPERTLPQVVGPTENALRALLVRELAGSPVPDYRSWVCLNVAAEAVPRRDLEERLARDVRSSDAAAREMVDRLVALGLVGPAGGLTNAGRELLADLRARIGGTTARLMEGIPEADAATSVRVLDALRHNAEAALGS